MSTEYVGVVVVTPTGDKDRQVIRVNLPRPISRVFIERGYTHARIRVVDEGVLVTPFHGDRHTNRGESLVLPEWDNGDQV